MHYEGTIQDFIEWAMNSEGSTFALFGKTIRNAGYKFTTALFNSKIEYAGKRKSNSVIIKRGDTDIVFHIFSHYQQSKSVPRKCNVMCKNCYWSETGGKWLHEGDYICCCDKSDYRAEYVDGDFCCEVFEERVLT